MAFHVTEEVVKKQFINFYVNNMDNLQGVLELRHGNT